MNLSLALCLSVTAASINGQVPLYDDQIITACDNLETMVNVALEYDLDPFVSTALIHYESRWRPDAVSNAGACGLTQVISGYSVFSCEELKVPEIGLGEGGRALRYWLNWAKGDYKKALACYRVGFECDKSPVGRNYAKVVMALSNKYLEMVLSGRAWGGYPTIALK